MLRMNICKVDIPTPPNPAAPAPFASGAPDLHVLASGLMHLPDPRSRARHPLQDVLFTALMALICDCDTYTEMAMFAEEQLDWLRLYVPLPAGAPSHDTFRYVLGLISPGALIGITAAWAGSLAGQHVRIDGKVSRGARDTETGRSRLHLLRAWVAESGLSAGQIACGEKSGELTALQQLLPGLELQGALVSIDAMGGHPEIARQLHEAGADWLLALKANEKAALESVSARFRTLSGQDAALPAGVEPAATLHPPHIAPVTWPLGISRHFSEEQNRGRCESREVLSIPVTDAWMPKGWLWYGIRSAVCVIRRTLRQRAASETPAFEVHYYLSSLPADAARLCACIRGHWAIENSCHHVLDVTWREDHCQVRERTSAHNQSILRELAARLLRGHPAKGSLQSKRKRASLNAKLRSEVIDSIFQRLHA